MHSSSPDKEIAPFVKEISEQLQTSYESRGNLTAVFAGFVFPSAFSVMDDSYSIDANGARFLGSVSFSSAKGSFDFHGSVFRQRARFDDLRWGRLDVSNCTFEDEAHFTHFRANASFEASRFERKAVFDDSRFIEGASFRRAILLDEVSFFRTEFGPQRQPEGPAPAAIADFSDAAFHKPELVRWFRVNRRTDSQGLHVRFLNCRVETMTFVDVKWAQYDDRRLLLQDELDLSRRYLPEGDEYYYQRTDHELVAVVYRQLGTAFERNRDYDLADGCFAGVWEMKRRDPTLPRWSRLAIDTYRFASAYGNSFIRAAVVLLVLVFVLFPCLYASPWAGLTIRADAGSDWRGILTHSHSVFESTATHFGLRIRELAGHLMAPVRRGLIFSVELATFARNPAYYATTFFGRMVAAAESLFVTGQAALFLLALRRRFRH